MRRQSGFALVEILLVLGILVLIAGLGLLMSMDVYRSYARRSERDAIVSVLQRARSRALANVSQSTWGACYSGSEYIVFRGATYANAQADVRVSANPAIIITDTSAPKKFACTDGGISFMQLTGDASSTSMTIKQGVSTSTISTNLEGTIIW